MQSDQSVGEVAEAHGTSPRRMPSPLLGGQTCYMTVNDLQRFVDAQDDRGTFLLALDELDAGRKQSHWVWFVLPQLAGLGMSDTTRFFALASLDEAAAYLVHPVLTPARDRVLAPQPYQGCRPPMSSGRSMP